MAPDSAGCLRTGLQGSLMHRTQRDWAAARYRQAVSPHQFHRCSPANSDRYNGKSDCPRRVRVARPRPDHRQRVPGARNRRGLSDWPEIHRWRRRVDDRVTARGKPGRARGRCASTASARTPRKSSSTGLGRSSPPPSHLPRSLWLTRRLPRITRKYVVIANPRLKVTQWFGFSRISYDEPLLQTSPEARNQTLRAESRLSFSFVGRARERLGSRSTAQGRPALRLPCDRMAEPGPCSGWASAVYASTRRRNNGSGRHGQWSAKR